MPEYAAARIGPRSALPAPALGYEIAQVVKGPAPETPAVAAEPSKANDLMQALGVAQKLIPVAVDVGMAIKEHRTKEGAQARFVGDALDPNQSNAFIDGYERMDGAYRGVAFGNAAQEFAKANSHLPPDEFQKGLDALQEEYVGKLIHQGQLDTFLPSAVKGGEHAASIYQEAKNAAVLQERDQKITDIHVGEVRAVLNQDAAEILGIPLNKGIDSIGTDPEMRARFDANEEAFRASVAPKLRKIMEKSAENYKALGLTPRDARANLVGVVGRIAADVGANSLNDFAYQNDASGMSPSTAFPDVMNKFSDQARAAGEHISAAMLLRAEKAKKAINEKLAGDWLMDLSFPGVTTETAQKIWMDVWNNKDLDANMKEKLANHARDVMLGMGYALNDNQAVARPLEFQISTGKLKGEPAYAALLSASRDLSQPTYRHLLALAKTGAEKSDDHSYSAAQQEFNTHLSSITKSIGLTDDIGKMMINLDIEHQGLLSRVVSNAQAMMFRGRDELIAKYGSLEKIPGAEFKPLHDRVMQLFTPQQQSVVNSAKALAGREVKNAPSSENKSSASTIITSEATGKGPALQGIPAGWTPTGEYSGGKMIYRSPDGKQESVGH